MINVRKKKKQRVSKLGIKFYFFNFFLEKKTWCKVEENNNTT